MGEVRRMAKTMYQQEVIVTDVENGDTRAMKETTVVRLPSEPPFIKMYIDDLSHFIGLKDRHKEIVFELIKKLDFEGMITLTPRSRQAISERLKISDQSFRNYLSEVVKTGLLKRISHNEFLVNPHYFARGDWNSVYDRRKEFVMEIRYTDKGRKINSRAVDIEPEERDLFDDQK
jgi:predicted transcriptional regulator